jgi:TATA-box binding protein (TBP) (component of TFIID and TFIIIB)
MSPIILPKIFNYKISFRTKIPFKIALAHLIVGENEIKSIKILHNYMIVKTHNNYVYSLNFSGFVNITGLKSENDIISAIKKLYELANQKIKRFRYNIDNITASGKFGCHIPLHTLRTYLNNHNINFPAQYTYNANFFCGGNLRYKNGGTIILFTTGSYTIVGVKCKKAIDTVFEDTMQLIEKIAKPGTM